MSKLIFNVKTRAQMNIINAKFRFILKSSSGLNTAKIIYTEIENQCSIYEYIYMLINTRRELLTCMMHKFQEQKLAVHNMLN